MEGRRWFWGAAAFCVVAVVALEVWGPANYWAGLIPEIKRGETDGLRWRALIIGVDEFPNLPTKEANVSAVAKKRKRPSDEFALTSCASDANAFADALVKYAGFKRKDVCVLTFKKGDALDSPNAPTAENIRRQVREFCEKSTENDALLVYFSGHGVMLDADVGGAEKESRSYLCACDA
ncbi:MAG: caspase family protein, partial [Thermoguttaceae bacterium]|nr:caspase family protein [Thermoguttaceae bacterium]